MDYLNYLNEQGLNGIHDLLYACMTTLINRKRRSMNSSVSRNSNRQSLNSQISSSSVSLNSKRE